jgi:anti-sigma regulatory factor (Ser/Thr protein kinase)
MSAAETRVIELTIPAQSRYLVLPRLGLAGIAPVAGLDEETLADLKLAVTEACANAVRHAYPEGEGDVHVRMELEPGRLVVRVADRGRGLQGDDVEAWDASRLREEGMGLSIIQAIVDELDIESSPGAGTALRLVKTL